MPRSRRQPALGSLVVAGLVTGILAGSADAIDVAPQDSVAALAEDLASTLTAARDLATVLGVPVEQVAATATCDGEGARLIRCEARASCHAALIELYDGFLVARDGADDPRSRRAAARVLTELAEMALRLASSSAEVEAGRCGRVSPPHSQSARMRLDADGRTARFSPLVLDGIPADARSALAESVVPRFDGDHTVIPAGTFLAPLGRLLAEVPAGIDAARARETAARVERDASGLPGLPALAVVQLTFPEPMSGAALRGLRARFLAIEGEPPADAVATFRVIDARGGLLAYRARLADLPCVETPARPLDARSLLGVPPASQGGLFEGRYRSLDIAGDGGVARALGVAAASAKVVELPYLLALPRDAGPETPLVIAVDGHMGSAVRALHHHAAGLLTRGLALLALEIPEHGERDTPEGEFVDRYDPLPVNRNMRQSATDVMAIVRMLSDCGLLLPDGSRYRPSRISYIGYSLGAMIGAVARGVEERLGPTVLLAGAGDLAGWLLLQLIPRLVPDLVSCIGGPEHGAACLATRTCAPPGRCGVDPGLFWLTEVFRPAYGLLTAGGDPLDFAGRRTGPASTAPLLLLTGGNDSVLHPLLATRLSDAYGMRPAAPGLRRGPRSTRLHFPDRGHEMVTAPEVQRVAYDFLADAGRHPPRSVPARTERREK
jgi:hypothetical protein